MNERKRANERGPANDLPRPLAQYRRIFPGQDPTHFARAPGRVNLIGEHTDYNGLPVLPVALQREIRVLFTPRNDATVRIANEASEFGERAFEISTEIPPDPPGDWANYAKAACQALARRLGPLRGFDGLISSTLPVASGLSSSSALVIAVGKAVLESNEVSLPFLELADEMARAEWYTGTRGGGMDQAISVGAREAHASRIEFDPLRMSHTPIPDGWRLVVAHSLVRAEKTGGAREAYNLRTRECREALRRMEGVGVLDAAGAGSRCSDHTGLTYPRLVQEVCLQDLVDLAEEHLSGALLKRFRHVVTEGNRVYDAEHAMKRGDRLTFGLLMNASHESLRDDYEVSCRELDTLVALALEAGAEGARLTGAGFGGCIVALASADRLDGVLEALEEAYYRPRGVSGHGADQENGSGAGGENRVVDPGASGSQLPTPALDRVLFVAEAAGGASVRSL